MNPGAAGSAPADRSQRADSERRAPPTQFATRHPPSVIRYRLLRGALAGFAATVPMSIVMLALHRWLPRHEQYPLPPRLIVDRLAQRLGLRRSMDEPEISAATVAGHFGYGSAAGALYGLATTGALLPGPGTGLLYGLLVWSGSYLGLLPALWILSPATRHPARRNALMIAAHLVWGGVLGRIVAAGGR